MEAIVYVLDMSGNPLMPTRRCGKVRRMLKNKQAHVVHAKPFTIQLDYEPKTKVCQDITLGINPGRTNIGYNTVCENGDCIMSGTMITAIQQENPLRKMWDELLPSLQYEQIFILYLDNGHKIY